MTVNGRTRETRQRRTVYDAVKQSHRHPTADWIFDRVRSQIPKISLGTVYRNLTVLKTEGMIREILGNDRRAHYEARMEPHAHFICTSCGEIADIEEVPPIEWRTLRDLVGYRVDEQRVEFLGLCPGCARRANN